jgi:TatD DNase family protein
VRDVALDLIDTHAHLDDERLKSDLPDVLQRARDAGVRRVLTIATTGADSEACVALAEKYETVWASVGLQPNNLAQLPATDFDMVVRLASSPKVTAIGETGLDRHWDYTPFAQQEDYFARHLELARNHQKAVVIHCRKAEADIVRMLRADFDKHGSIRAVMHSFTGDQATAMACLEMGLHISFAGMLTYRNAEDLRTVAKEIPLDRLLVETDSPYLAPVPLRGKRNEPAFVVHTATVLAGLHQLDLNAMAEHTTRNAEQLFKLAN